MKKYLISAFALLLSAVSFTSCNNNDEDVYVEEPQEQEYDVLVNGLAYNINLDDMTASVVPTAFPSTYSGNINIPSSISVNGKDIPVTEIGYSAFYQSDITGVTFPNTLVTIKKSSFNECSNLTKVSFPSSLITIEEDAFAYSGLQSVSIPANILEASGFYNSDELIEFTVEDSTTPIVLSWLSESVEKFYLGRNTYSNIHCSESMKTFTIGEYVTDTHWIDGIKNPFTIICYAVNPPSTTWNTSDNNFFINSKVYVPAESIELYKESSTWGKFFSIEAIN